MPRMRILSAADQARLEHPPFFDSAERKRYFDFPQFAMDVAQGLRGPANQIGFLLAYGYFRAAQRFFSPEQYRERDIAFVSRVIAASPSAFSVKAYKERTRLRHQKLILDLLGYQPFDAQAEAHLVTEIATMVRAHLKPRLIFRRCIDVLIEKRIQVPGVRRLTDLIRAELSARKSTLVRLVDTHLTPHLRQMLDDLFMQEDGANRYRLTLLKTFSQSAAPGKIKETAADFETLSDMYRQITSVFEGLAIGTEGIRYYAGGVQRSEMFQLQRRSHADRYLHAIAFIADQHHRLQDAMVDLLLSVMQSFETAATRDHKEEVFARRKTEGARLEGVLDVIDTEVLGPLREIRTLVDDETMPDARKLERIRAILDRDQESAVERLRADIRRGTAENGQYHRILEHRSVRLQNRINPILRRIALKGDNRMADLMAAIAYFREKDGSIGPGMPLGFLTSTERETVSNGLKGFRVSLCKVFLFQHVAGAIKAGNLNLEGSYKYRPLDDYLISRERWDQEKPALLARAGLSEFTDLESVLKALDNALHRQYENTNRGASEATNPYLKIAAPGNFRVATPALNDVESAPLRDILPKQHLVPLSEVLATVDQHCGLLDEFRHWQQVHVHQAPAPAVMIAGIMGLGCAIGVQKMARISHSITGRELEHTVNWRFSLDNTIAANDRVVAAMERMELPQIYRKSQDKLHTSSDGQKFEVRRPSLNASHSFKYFGQGQGVSAYTFIDERNLLWYSLVFSASEHESAYVIDGLMHNDVIQSDIHSTDEHGFKEAIFCVTHLLGLSYAPRFKNLKKQILYQFRERGNEGAAWVIMPAKYVNESAIRDSWDDLLRLVATIKLKEATASEIFRRLNSYSRQHSLYKAMKAFGQIIKSLFILRYVDDLELRQAIEKQLNKVKLANSFTRAVAVGNPRGLEHADKAGQEIAESCNRLIKNSIICWNYLYLTRRIEAAKTPEERDKLLQMIATHSPQSWGHVNSLGEYDFSDEKLQDTIGVLPPKSVAQIIPDDWEPPIR